MSKSSLVNYTKISPNRTSPRNHRIDTITIHCVVGQLSVETIGNVFAPSSAQASSNYGIGSDGRIGMYVDEGDRSWCSSNAANDHRAITIECASDTTHPYTINSKVYASLINLCVDICKRNGIKELKWKGDKSLIGQVDKQNMTVHRWFANKACPGDYIYNRLGQIASEVNAKLNNTSVITPTETKNETVTNSDVLYRVQVGAFRNKSNAEAMLAKLKSAGYSDAFIATSVVTKTVTSTATKSIDAIAREVIAGDWGNAEDRKVRLAAAGYDYSAVQQRVNELLKEK